MRVVVNGTEREVAARTISGLVAELGLAAPLVLVEHQGVALRRSEWTGAQLSEGDRIEILRVAAGG